jgi:MarR family transcriptional regulator, lower aerobic nicotinate degradation pathway regulator
VRIGVHGSARPRPPTDKQPVDAEASGPDQQQRERRRAHDEREPEPAAVRLDRERLTAMDVDQRAMRSMAVRRPPSLLALPSYLTSQLSKFGRRHLEEVLAEHELVLIHHGVLAALADFGPQSQQQLADSLDFHKSHLVARIDELQRRGLVTRTQDRADRRRNQIALTPTGRELVDSLRPVAVESQHGFLEALSPAEQETLVALLRRALDANDAARDLAAHDTTAAPHEHDSPPSRSGW